MSRPILATVIAPLLVAILLTGALAGCARVEPAPEVAPELPEPQPIEPEETAPAEPEEPILTIDDVYQSISLSVQAGDPTAAIAEYERAQLENPDEPATRVLLANLYLIGGDLVTAKGVLASVLDTEPQNTDALYLQSLIAGAEGDRELQRSFLEQLLQAEPEDPQALASLGELRLQDEDLDGAEEVFEAALQTDSGSLVARMGLANVYLRQEQYEKAEAELDTVVESNPDYGFAYADRAMARALQRELEPAKEDLSRAIELNPDFPWNYIDRGRVLMEQRRFLDAEADFSRALEIDSSRFITYALRGRARDALDRVDEALADYEEALRLRPDYYPAYLPTGVLYYLADRFEEAAVFVQGAFENDERRIELILLAALAMKRAGDEQAAEGWINSKLSLLPRDGAFYDVARFYLLPINDSYVLNEIRQDSNETVSAQAHFYVGAQLELIGRPATAQAVLLEAENSVPQGVLERRLATHHLDSYRSGSSGDE